MQKPGLFRSDGTAEELEKWYTVAHPDFQTVVSQSTPIYRLELYGRVMSRSQISAIKNCMITDLHLENVRTQRGAFEALIPNAYLLGISLDHTDVEDRVVRAIAKGMPHLVQMSLYGTATSGACEEIGRLEKLRVLGLGGTCVTDRNMSQLAGLKSIRTLRLSETRITDDAIQHLVQMRSLKSLNIKDTAITPDGYKRLRVALPVEVDIESDHGKR
jgi:hypothetical protein